MSPVSTESVENIEAATTGTLPDAASAPEPSSKSCASACGSAKYKATAFIVPFLAVTAYSLTQETACVVGGTHACAASAVVLGLMAGATSLGLVSAIKALKARRPAA